MRLLLLFSCYVAAQVTVTSAVVVLFFMYKRKHRLGEI